MKILIFLILVSAGVHAKNDDIPKGFSKEEYNEYMAGCKKMILNAQPGKDAKDVEMLCSDPYLNGKKNESSEDKARRLRLIDETTAAKTKALEKYVVPPLESSESKTTVMTPEQLKVCKKSLLDADPGKDPADADMLCRDPYLKGKSNESYDEEVRRKRLIQETKKQKNNMLDRHRYMKPTPPPMPVGPAKGNQ